MIEVLKKILKFINNNGVVSSLSASLIIILITLLLSNEGMLLAYEEALNQKIYDSDENKEFLLLSSNLDTINKKVYFFKLEFWNQRNSPIERSDLKDFVEIQFDQESRIFSNLEVIETHPKVTNAKTEVDSTKNTIQLKFDFLEIGNGIKIQGYYQAESKSNLLVKGYIARGGRIEKYQPKISETIKVIKSTLTILYLIFAIELVKFLNKVVGQKTGFKFDNNWKGMISGIIYLIVNIVIIYWVYRFLVWGINLMGEYLGINLNMPSPF